MVRTAIAMTPEQEQALKTHLEAIAQILYDDSDPETMKTLEGIELTVRQQIQAHVSPELGSFYPNGHKNTSRQAKKAKKHLRRFRNHLRASKETGSCVLPSIESTSRELLSGPKCERILRASGTGCGLPDRCPCTC